MRIDPFAPRDLTQDDFLGGKARLWQPRTGYRAGIDPVLLAASVQARPGQSVLELGCGGGAALVCLGTRVGGLSLTGVELQPGYAALARDNLRANGLQGMIADADLTDLPRDIRSQSFDHVMANPPYFQSDHRTRASDPAREIALAGDTPLADWAAVAAKRLKPGGQAVFIQNALRLPDLLSAMAAHLGSLELLPLAPRPGRAPNLIVLRGRKGGRAGFRFLPALALHQPATTPAPHGKDYSPAIHAVLTEAAALEFPG